MKRLFYKILIYLLAIPTFIYILIYKLNINKQIEDLEIYMDSDPIKEYCKILLYKNN